MSWIWRTSDRPLCLCYREESIGTDDFLFAKWEKNNDQTELLLPVADAHYLVRRIKLVGSGRNVRVLTFDDMPEFPPIDV